VKKRGGRGKKYFRERKKVGGSAEGKGEKGTMEQSRCRGMKEGGILFQRVKWGGGSAFEGVNRGGRRTQRKRGGGAAERRRKTTASKVYKGGFSQL